MPVSREFTVPVGYGTIACRQWGEDGLAAERYLAVHGWLDNAGSFDPLMERFVTEDRCVVCIDLPGHGFSSHLPKGVGYSLNIDIQAIRSVILHLQWKRYGLIGHSMGGNKIHYYSVCWPGEIDCVICFDAGIIPLDFGLKDADPFADFAKQIDRLIGAGYSGKHKARTWQGLYDSRVQVMPGVTRQNHSILMKRGCIRQADGLYLPSTDPNIRYKSEAVFMYSQDTIFKAMQRLGNTPQLLIRSDGFYLKLETREQEKLGFVFFSKLTKAYPGEFKVATLKGPHHFHMQNPVETTRIVNEFLSEHKTRHSSKL